MRCDRNDPCSNCTSRHISCSYKFTAQPRSSFKARRKVNNPLDRLRRLEELVACLTSDQEGIDKESSGVAAGGRTPARSDASSFELAFDPKGESTLLGKSSSNQLADQFGRLEMNNGQMIYLSATHWATICDEVMHQATIHGSLLVGETPMLTFPFTDHSDQRVYRGRSVRGR